MAVGTAWTCVLASKSDAELASPVGELSPKTEAGRGGVGGLSMSTCMGRHGRTQGAELPQWCIVRLPFCFVPLHRTVDLSRQSPALLNGLHSH